jgi:superfamily II DNA or RNA helicase
MMSAVPNDEAWRTVAMLREEQIDLRRRRAAESPLQIKKLGRNRVFTDYEVKNPKTDGSYRITIRGFDIGDNACDCPDFRSNTLGTCKHIEAVLATLRDEPPQVRRKKAAVIRPEIYLRYGEQVRVGAHLPPRCSDALRGLADTFFDAQGFWKGGDRYARLLEAVQAVPEPVTIFSDAMEFMEREDDRRAMAERERELVEQIERCDPDSPLHDLVKAPLYDYQMRGAAFLACRGRSILGDDMGLGKTVQALAATELLARERGVERVLVVAPSSVKYQWDTEIRKFTDRAVQVIDGTAAERRTKYQQPTFYRLVNYEIAVKDLETLNSWRPDLIVLDEAQRIKNWQSKTSRAVKKLRSKYAMVLTGTPLENKLEELYSIVSFVDDRRLGPAFQFLHDHSIRDAEWRLVGYRDLDKVREKLAPIFLRRTRAEVLTQLPARTDTTVYVELADEQRGPYADQHNTLARLVQKKYLSEVDRRRILCCIANLRMLCDSTFLYDKQTNVSPKLAEFEELLRDLLGSGPHKVVVFSQWEQMLRKAAEVVERLGVGHALLCGNVPGKERRGLLERFRDEPECRVFLSTDAGGVGLNLQSADTVINLELPWNPAVLEQRIARVHRMGQQRPVQVFNLVTRDSIEERVLRTLERKRALFEGVFSGASDEMALDGLGNQAFLATVRELVVEEKPTPAAEAAAPAVAADGAEQARRKVVEAGVQFLEALAEAFGGAPISGRNGMAVRLPGPGVNPPLPPSEALERGAAALRRLIDAVGGVAGAPRTNGPVGGGPT